MYLQSLDPRMNRLQIPENWEADFAAGNLDQLETFEVFQQKRENTPFVYVGPVHAPDLEVAFLFAKEQYSRRATCFGLWVVRTRDILVTPYVNDDESVFQILNIAANTDNNEQTQDYELFSLKKRGKAHSYLGTVTAVSPEDALAQAKNQFANQQPCVNIWIIPAAQILKSEPEDQEMWTTTAEKKYREPVDYKVQDKINAFKLEKGA